MKKRSLILWPALAVVAALVVWAIFQGTSSSPPRMPTGKFEEVRQGSLQRLVISTGTVKPQVGAEVKVGARVSGRVDQLLVAVGQEVEAGQVVAVIEHRELKARLAQAQAEREAAAGRLRRLEVTGPKEIAQYEAEVTEIRAMLEQARLEHGRQANLQAKAFVSTQEMERALREAKVLQARLQAARARLVKAQVALEEDISVAKAELAAVKAQEDTAHINLDYATLRAPISGVVSSITTQEGETVAASLNAPTFINIVDLGRLQVDDYVDETDIGLVKVGQEAFFTVDAYPGRNFRGKVEAVHPSALLIDNVVYYTVVIQITEPYRDLLKPEMTASISIVVDKKDKAVWVPSQAVRLREGRQTVFVQRDGRVEPRDVEVGWSEAGRSEIVSGLAPGQKVLVPGSRQNSGPPRR